MGVRIFDEDGSLLHEFPDGLGAPILNALLGIAKFSGDADEKVILNPHVVALARSLLRANTYEGMTPRSLDEVPLAHAHKLRIVDTLCSSILGGRIHWPRMTSEEKITFVREILLAPYTASDDYTSEIVEDLDWQIERVRRALNQE